MLKGKAELEFKFYRDSAGMEMYVMKPVVEHPAPPQEGEDVHPQDEGQETLDLEKEKEADPLDETPEQPEGTGDPLVLTPYKGGLSTGSKMDISFECSTDVMKSLMDAERMGLAPCFTFSIK